MKIFLYCIWVYMGMYVYIGIYSFLLVVNIKNDFNIWFFKFFLGKVWDKILDSFFIRWVVNGSSKDYWGRTEYVDVLVYWIYMLKGKIDLFLC